MLDFIVSPKEVYGASGDWPVRVTLYDADYPFFSRYFADARLDWSDNNFLGYWGGSFLSGYQLVRLRHVLQDALSDLSARPPQFRVLSGWTGPQKTEATETWHEVQRDHLIELTRELIAAIDLARETTDYLQAIGD